MDVSPYISPFWHVENEFLLKRYQDWEDSFQNLYYMLRKNQLNIFYGILLTSNLNDSFNISIGHLYEKSNYFIVHDVLIVPAQKMVYLC